MITSTMLLNLDTLSAQEQEQIERALRTDCGIMLLDVPERVLDKLVEKGYHIDSICDSDYLITREES